MIRHILWIMGSIMLIFSLAGAMLMWTLSHAEPSEWWLETLDEINDLPETEEDNATEGR